MEYRCYIWKTTVYIYTVLLLIPPLSSTDPAPVLDTTPVTVEVVRGENATLPCFGTNFENYEVSWLDSDFKVISVDSKIMKSDPRLLVDMSEGKRNLIILYVKLSDSAQYQCMLQFYPPQFKYVVLKVLVPAEIDKTKMQERYMFKTGSSLTIECPIKGVPEPEVYWLFFKTNTGSMEEVQEKVSANKILHLSNLSAADAGIYRCEAWNNLAKDMYEIFLQHVYEPIVTTTNKHLVVKLGSRSVLQCEVDSSPSARIGWQRKQSLIQTDWKYKVSMYAESETKKLAELTIEPTEYSDAGEYFCIASNQYGRYNLRFTIAVEDYATSTTMTAAGQPITTPTEVIMTTQATSSETRSEQRLSTTSNKPANIVTPKTEASRDSGCNSISNTAFTVTLCSLLFTCLVSL